jgi:hypothetical protein
MNAAVEPIDGGKATLAELRAGIDALARALINKPLKSS